MAEYSTGSANDGRETEFIEQFIRVLTEAGFYEVEGDEIHFTMLRSESTQTQFEEFPQPFSYETSQALAEMADSEE